MPHAIERELRALADPKRAAVSRRFFKTGPGEYGEGDRFLGIPVPAVRALVARHKDIALRELDTLLSSPWHEVRAFALLALVRAYEKGTSADKKRIYELYLKRTEYINNWDLVDTSAEHIVGAHLLARGRAPLARLARSPNVWERRIAVLATFHFIRRAEYDETLALAKRLLRDEHDLIHKAVGWMLREIGNRDGAVLERFLARHAAAMPRTMLRYAVERLPPARRAHFMKA